MSSLTLRNDKSLNFFVLSFYFPFIPFFKISKTPTKTSEISLFFLSFFLVLKSACCYDYSLDNLSAFFSLFFDILSCKSHDSFILSFFHSFFLSFFLSFKIITKTAAISPSFISFFLSFFNFFLFQILLMQTNICTHRTLHLCFILLED